MPFVDIDGAQLEYVRLPAPTAADKRRPTLVFLHEGLGSLAMWRDFPAEVAAATGCPALVYSRRGYGQSDPMPGPRGVDYMHREAEIVLPQLLDRLGIDWPVLIGHSDGGSIAILYADLGRYPVAGLVLMAAHVFVEDITVASIEAARETYRTTDLSRRLGRYHRNPDHAFWGWNDIWLDPAFRAWNIEAAVPGIAAPLLVIQGKDDEYGTEAQCRAIQSQARAPCEVLMLDDCRHSPHRDQPEATRAAIARFVAAL